jgi:hypothetical protein
LLGIIFQFFLINNKIQSEKDLKLVYLEPIFNDSSLSEIIGVAMVKPSNLPENYENDLSSQSISFSYYMWLNSNIYFEEEEFLFRNIKLKMKIGVIFHNNKHLKGL